ncbi:serine hydrolase domain-containing protein [Microbacterium arabinogalactanolyticum]|uniref:serine hydrolase domain-containing protein n=1 Tax=Microbacterium arabinogalactanolyticum TaxID=69365 RepID=UPI0025552C13|nr:serine hydrolase domain-containing protein [Microbacterium arabinogalactanolyticum]GLC84948.1 EstA family serine hydrolase [Microbacterium arabinogalactanolyticum]
MRGGVPFESVVVAPGYENARDVFTGLLHAGQEIGASVAVRRDGAPVLEMHGGWQDGARTRPWTAGTLAMTYSVGKPLAAVAALRAVAEGRVGLDDPVSAWWPEYARQGKRRTTLRHMLSHTAGVPAFSDASIDPLDRGALVADLVGQRPLWEPGTVPAEHALTYGHLIDGALTALGAADIRSSAAELGSRLGADLRFGVDESDLPRVADLEIIDATWAGTQDHELAHRARTIPAGMLDPAVTNSDSVRTASFPAIGLFTNATSLARFYDDLAREDGPLSRMLGSGLLREFTTAQAIGTDRFLDAHAEWGLGLRVDDGEWGMGGIGGSCAWHHPGRGYSFAYVTRGLGTFDRVDALADAVEAAIAAGA